MSSNLSSRRGGTAEAEQVSSDRMHAMNLHYNEAKSRPTRRARPKKTQRPKPLGKKPMPKTGGLKRVPPAVYKRRFFDSEPKHQRDGRHLGKQSRLVARGEEILAPLAVLFGAGPLGILLLSLVFGEVTSIMEDNVDGAVLAMQRAAKLELFNDGRTTSGSVEEIAEAVVATAVRPAEKRRAEAAAKERHKHTLDLQVVASSSAGLL